MASETNPRPRRSVARRVSRVVSFGFYAGLLLWITWLAVTRWNGVPADPRGALGIAAFNPPIDPEWDRTEELTAALAAIPTPGTLVLPPPPPGMKWGTPPSTTVVLDDVIAGAWTPDTRPNLQSAIQFLRSPSVESAIEDIAAISPGGWRPFGSKGPGISGMRIVRQARLPLLGRARYHHAEVGDVDAALADYGALFRLVSITNDSGNLIGVLVAQACENEANTELVHLARERSLTPSQALRMIELLRSSFPDANDQWQALIDIECGEMEHTVDLSYTDDGDGNGWLVLGYFDELALPTWAPERRSGAWNLLSPLFNNRRTLTAKIERLRGRYENPRHVPFAEAVRILNDVPIEFGVADVPLAGRYRSWSLAKVYQQTVKRVSRRHATIVALALSAYRFDHGHYPASLHDLDETYLTLPALDPYIEGPFCYERRDDEYILYSVGPNQVDDGGRKRTWNRQTLKWRLDGDLLFTEPRLEPQYEPTLEKI